MKVADDDIPVEDLIEEQEEQSEQASELVVMEAIDRKYRDRVFADKVERLQALKINKDSLIEVKEFFDSQWTYYFKKAKDNVREANKYKERLAKSDESLTKYSHDPFLQTWIYERNEIIDHLTTANASSEQLNTFCAYVVPKLLDELGKFYSLGARNYLNQETKDRLDQKFVELLAMGQELGYNLPEKAKQAVIENNRLKEKLRTLAMTKAESRRQMIAKELFDIILAKTNFEKKTYPTASECYREVKYARADVIEAKDYLIKTGRLKEEGKGRGSAKRLVLKVNQFVLVKSGSGGTDKYSNSRENPPPRNPGEQFGDEISENEDIDEVNDAENTEPDGEPGDRASP